MISMDEEGDAVIWTLIENRICRTIPTHAAQTTNRGMYAVAHSEHYGSSQLCTLTSLPFEGDPRIEKKTHIGPGPAGSLGGGLCRYYPRRQNTSQYSELLCWPFHVSPRVSQKKMRYDRPTETDEKTENKRTRNGAINIVLL